ncbi:hypothetical protein [Rhodococcus qingshengii]|uniref:hypothetical protein n=1 Tax=Rhodococcus qingshengii TaxID=334542 RepID=UPI00210B1CDE|nr:hypothetical protein [Rhodococcus qingshengii]MCQ4148621.1 hypothetical protein [Rhodococcus qingshengii]
MTIEAELHRAVVVDRSISLERVAGLTKRSAQQVRQQILGEREFSVSEIVVIAHALQLDWKLLIQSCNSAT